MADGFEQVEMTKPREALDQAGAETKIVSLKSGKIQGMHHADKSDKFDVDLTLDEARPDKFDALLIPGGVHNPDTMRTNQKALGFARHFFRESKPVAVILSRSAAFDQCRPGSREKNDVMAGNPSRHAQRRRALGRRGSRRGQWLSVES